VSSGRRFLGPKENDTFPEGKATRERGRERRLEELAIGNIEQQSRAAVEQ